MSPAALIVGATSGIGRALARKLASEGYDLVLAGRRADELERIAADVTLRFGTRADSRHFDALDFAGHVGFFRGCTEAFESGLEGVLLCHGEMAEQDEAQADPERARRMIDVNYTSSVSLLEPAAAYLETRGQGWICAVTSVAGDRGRPSNYLYGATKGALSTYLQGLRARLASAGVAAVNVKPGFVDTSLTYGRPGVFLAASPEAVARDIWRGIRRGRAVVYTPWFWRFIMGIIRLIPDRIFNRLPL